MLFKSFINCFCISHFEEGLKKHYQNSVYLWTLLLQPRIQHFSVLRYPRLALMPSYSCQIITEQLWFSLCCFYVQIRALFIWLWPHSDTLFFAKVLSCPLCMGLSEGKSTQAIPYVIHNGPFPLSFPWLTPPPPPLRVLRIALLLREPAWTLGQRWVSLWLNGLWVTSIGLLQDAFGY